jgi:NADPH2:quinone reductase
MRALLSTTTGIKLADIAPPTPGPQDILVKVQAIGMNRIDLVALRDPKNQIIGMEWAGEIVQLGSHVKDFAIGDRVMCTGSGAYAEFAVADAQRCCAVPESMSWESAASLLLGLQTMHDALVTQGGLVKESSVLIQGAAACMGLIGMQMAAFLGASTVIGTSRNPAHRSELKQFGCDVAVDSSIAGWHQAVLAATRGQGASIVVDQVSGEATNECMAAAAIGGTIVNVGRLAGASGAFDFNLHALRRLHYVGVTFRTRSPEQVRRLNARMKADAIGLLPAIRVPLAGCFGFDQASEALACLADSTHLGKVVLMP